MLNRKGSILISVYLVIFVLTIFIGMVVTRSINERKFFDISRERTNAFYLAEAAVDTAIFHLRGDYNGYSGTPSPASLGEGEYEISIATLDPTKKKITATGYIPSKAQERAKYSIEAITKKLTPPNFYDYAIYSAGDLRFTGNSYDVTGKAIYAGTGTDLGRISGGATFDPSISPLAHFDFQILRDIAVAQGNLYDATRLNNHDPFPTNFWYQPPSDPDDPETGIPNVVYVEGALVLSGNTTAGGFYLVVGNILQDPAVTIDTTMNGNVTVNGCIYTTGDFTINGGGNGLNINGGVWTGTGADIKGNSKVTYNYDFMMSIKHLVDINSAGAAIQLLSWRQLA